MMSDVITITISPEILRVAQREPEVHRIVERVQSLPPNLFTADQLRDISRKFDDFTDALRKQEARQAVKVAFDEWLASGPGSGRKVPERFDQDNDDPIDFLVDLVDARLLDPVDLEKVLSCDPEHVEAILAHAEELSEREEKRVRQFLIRWNRTSRRM